MTPERKEQLKQPTTWYRIGMILATIVVGVFQKLNYDSSNNIEFQIFKVQTTIEQRQMEISKLDKRVEKAEGDIDRLKERVYSFKNP